MRHHQSPPPVAGWRGEHAVGEASTSYTKAPVYADAPDKIARTLPGAKLIFLLRDPVAQIVSQLAGRGLR